MRSSLHNDPHAPSQMDAARYWLGPDDLRVHLEGPELLSVPGMHIGACTYEFDFQVTVPGQYRVVAIAERADFDGMAEILNGRTHCG